MIIFIVIIGLSLLILFHELGHFFVAKLSGMRVDEFGIGFPPRIWGKKIGNTLYSVNALPFGGFVKIAGENGNEKEGQKQEDIFTSKPIWKRSAVILAGVTMNFIIGWFALSAVFVVGIPEHLMISDVANDSPAAIAGIEQGDVVLRATHNEFVLTDPIPLDDFISSVKTSYESDVELELQRGSEMVTVSLRGREIPPVGEGSLGIGLVEIGAAPLPFFTGILEGFLTAGAFLGTMISFFIEFFSKVFVDPSIVKNVAGPVGIVSIASQAGSLGLVYLINLFAIISLNLTVLNLIPFPALDGGRFVLLIVEKIKGSPLSTRVQQVVNAFGFVVLIALMVVVTIQDIGKLLS